MSVTGPQMGAGIGAGLGLLVGVLVGSETALVMGVVWAAALFAMFHVDQRSAGR